MKCEFASSLNNFTSSLIKDSVSSYQVYSFENALEFTYSKVQFQKFSGGNTASASGEGKLAFPFLFFSNGPLLKIISLDLDNLRVTEDISKERND